MEISDTDILLMDEWEVDLRVINAPKLHLRSQGKTLKSIRIKSASAGYDLLEQILKHQEVLREAEKISTRDS